MHTVTQTYTYLSERRHKIADAALKEITINYREASLANVADAYGISLAYASECVRAMTGKTYKTLLQKKRLEVAARLLRCSDLSIKKIMDLVGYANSSYFYRLFYNRYRKSPHEYRKSFSSAMCPHG